MLWVFIAQTLAFSQSSVVRFNSGSMKMTDDIASYPGIEVRALGLSRVSLGFHHRLFLIYQSSRAYARKLSTWTTFVRAEGNRFASGRSFTSNCSG